MINEIVLLHLCKTYNLNCMQKSNNKHLHNKTCVVKDICLQKSFQFKPTMACVLVWDAVLLDKSAVLFFGHMGNRQVPVWEIGNDDTCCKIYILKFCYRIIFKQGAFCITYPNGDRRFLTAIF